MNLISIICPLYNKQKYIANTIESVLAQTNENWELIIIDDGSTDDSLNIALSYSKTNRNITVLERKNFSQSVRGANVCRNIGAYNATASHLLFLDADDILLDNCIQQRLSSLLEKPSFSLTIFNVAYCRGNPAQVYAKEKPGASDRLKYMKTNDKRRFFLTRFLQFDLPWHTSGPIWNKDFFLTIGGFNTCFQRLQDPEIHTRALLNENVSINYLMLETDYDLLHRMDEDRVVWENDIFYTKQLESVKQYITCSISLLQRKDEKVLAKYLKGYLIFAETLTYRFLRKDFSKDKKERYLTELDKLYKEREINKICNSAFSLFLIIYRKTLTKRKIRMRIPGFLLYLMKLVFNRSVLN